MTTDAKTVAEPSAATPIHYDTWDEHGTPMVSKKPDPPKTEEPAASESSAKETQSEPKGKNAGEAETPQSQEKPKERKPGEKKSADERIAELTAKIRDLEERERSRAQEPKPASRTESKQEDKPSEPATYADWKKAFKPKDWIEKYVNDNPAASYEEAVSAMADHQADIRDRYRQLDQTRQEGIRRGQEMLRKAVEKYPNAETQIKETAKTIFQGTPEDVPPFVKALIDDSEVMGHLLYTLSDPKTLSNFLETARTSPGKAIRALRDMELQIEKELAKPADDTKPVKREADAKKETPPAEPKPRAPKPPTDIGGRGTGQEDAEVAAARANDFKAFDTAMSRRHFTRA